LCAHRIRGAPVGTRSTSLRPLAFSMLSNSPQGPNRIEVTKDMMRGWATQAAEGNLFPAKPRTAVAITACRKLADGRVEWLLIQRGKAPNYAEWSLPGGSIELGEGTLAAARRELEEETHLKGADAVFYEESFMSSDAIVSDELGNTLFHYVITQMFAVVSEDAEVRAGDDAMDIGWFTQNEIQAQSFGKVTKDVLKVVQRAASLDQAGLLGVPKP
jgi:8-oxo-dGTP diphosphatase